MTITDPEIIKKVQAAKDQQKKDYEANRGKKQGRMVTVTVCKACKSNVGTFQYVRGQDDKGRPIKVLVHVNCPGKRK
jgi:hypothetical protein